MQQCGPVPKVDNWKHSQYLEILSFWLDYFLIKMRYIRQELITLCFEILHVFPGFMVLKKLQNFQLVDWLQIKKANSIILPAF